MFVHWKSGWKCSEQITECWTKTFTTAFFGVLGRKSRIFDELHCLFIEKLANAMLFRYKGKTKCRQLRVQCSDSINKNSDRGKEKKNRDEGMHNKKNGLTAQTWRELKGKMHKLWQKEKYQNKSRGSTVPPQNPISSNDITAIVILMLKFWFLTMQHSESCWWTEILV